MTIVTTQMSVSADGCYAGPAHADILTWLDGPEAAGFFRVTRWAIDAEAWRQRMGFGGGEQNTNSEVIAETFDAADAYVMGRRMADGGEIPWGNDPPFRAPVFVVTSRPRQTLHRHGGTSFTYESRRVPSPEHRRERAVRLCASGKGASHHQLPTGYASARRSVSNVHGWHQPGTPPPQRGPVAGRAARGPQAMTRTP